ncbi:MAG: hypothetical protein CFE41_10420 [Burkholderiales bacterium PBB2]|nr:MAG: hypothetical protein CFE41_10420 [Burkholderiales bacterium PBB2]
MAVHSAYISKPTAYDSEWRLVESVAQSAKALAASQFQPAPVNAHGWEQRADVLGAGLYRVELRKGNFYRFSSNNDWSFNLTVYDEAGYQLYAGVNEPDRIGSLGHLSYPMLALRDGAAFVKVETSGDAGAAWVDLRVERSTASLGADVATSIQLAALGSGSDAAQAEAAFYGGDAGNRIAGKPQAANLIYAGNGDDVIELKTASDKLSWIDGGLARDTLVLGFPSHLARLKRINAFGPFRLVVTPPVGQHDAHLLSGSPDGARLVLRSIERIQFSDKTVEMKELPGF